MCSLSFDQVNPFKCLFRIPPFSSSGYYILEKLSVYDSFGRYAINCTAKNNLFQFTVF